MAHHEAALIQQSLGGIFVGFFFSTLSPVQKMDPQVDTVNSDQPNSPEASMSNSQPNSPPEVQDETSKDNEKQEDTSEEATAKTGDNAPDEEDQQQQQQEEEKEQSEPAVTGELIKDLFNESESEDDEEFEGFKKPDTNEAKGDSDDEGSAKPTNKDGDENDDDEDDGQVKDLDTMDPSQLAAAAGLDESSSDDDIDDANRSSRSDIVYDFDLMMQRKKEENYRRRKRKNIDIINDSDDIIADIIQQMKQAAEVRIFFCNIFGIFNFCFRFFKIYFNIAKCTLTLLTFILSPSFVLNCAFNFTSS